MITQTENRNLIFLYCFQGELLLLWLKELHHEKTCFSHMQKKGADQHCFNSSLTAPLFFTAYRKVPKFSDTRKLCYNLHKIQTKRVVHLKKQME